MAIPESSAPYESQDKLADELDSLINNDVTNEEEEPLSPPIKLCHGKPGEWTGPCNGGSMMCGEPPDGRCMYI